MIPVTITGNIKSIHFIGIGGIGMSGLAEYYLKKGYKVSGSDVTDSHITKRLEDLGAHISIGHNAGNINDEIETVVYTSAVKRDNPEIRRAEELGIKFLKRAEALGSIVNDKFLIAVAGTHGKTSTTAMVGKLLMDAGYDPTIFVGGNVSILGGAASKIGNSNYAVVEADEYDRSFLTLNPDIAVILNVDKDHMDIYKDLNDIKDTFKKFCNRTKENANVIYCGDDKNINSFINTVNKNKISYGFIGNNSLTIDNITLNGKLSFDIKNSYNTYKDISLNVIGRHNVLNASACFAVSKILGIDFNTYKNSIGTFTTVDRRLQLEYTNDIIVYDDYAHHPAEIESSLNALREYYKGKRLVAVFQPHLYSRTKDFYKEFAEKLSIADEVVLLEIYPAREEPMEGVTSELIYKELVKKNTLVNYIPDTKKVINYLNSHREKNSVIVFEGAGDVTILCDEFVLNLKNGKK